MSGRMASSNRVAIVGYAQSPVQRHADRRSAPSPRRRPGRPSPTLGLIGGRC